MVNETGASPINHGFHTISVQLFDHLGHYGGTAIGGASVVCAAGGNTGHEQQQCSDGKNFLFHNYVNYWFYKPIFSLTILSISAS